jgi:hypothetical protein
MIIVANKSGVENWISLNICELIHRIQNSILEHDNIIIGFNSFSSIEWLPGKNQVPVKLQLSGQKRNVEVNFINTGYVMVIFNKSTEVFINDDDTLVSSAT